MKRLIILLVLLSCICAKAQQAIVGVTLTVNGIPTNGMQFAVNGYTYTWTNNVTSANSQIPTTNTIAWSATNLWATLISYPAAIPGITVQMTATNILQFLSYATNTPGITLSTNAGAGAPTWASWTYTTNFLSAAIFVRVPSNAAPSTIFGLSERTNVESGIVGLLNDGLATNTVNPSNSLWTNFFVPVTNAQSSATLNNPTNWKNTNGNGFVYLTGTNIAIFDQNTNLQFGPVTLTNAERFMGAGWILTNTTNTMNFHAFNPTP